MNHLVISCSLSSNSRSRIMAQTLTRLWTGEASATYLDLCERSLPFCDAGACYTDANVLHVTEQIRQANTVTLAVPIYNFDVGGVARNLIAVTGKAWTEKIVGFICAAGGQGSYMAVTNLANSLMLDFRTMIVPRFVYADGKSFDGDELTDLGVKDRIQELANTMSHLGHTLPPKRWTGHQDD